MLKDRPEVSVETILKGNDKRTWFYTGMPTYDLFAALVDLEPKALQLTAWRSGETSGGKRKFFLVFLNFFSSQPVTCRVDQATQRIKSI